MHNRAEFRADWSNHYRMPTSRGFWIFQDGGNRHLVYQKFKICNGRNGRRVSNCVTMPNVMALGHWPNRPRDIAIFGFFKMATAAILDFTFLTVGTVKKVELRHPAKFLRNRPNRGPDMAIFAIFKDGGHAISDF